MAIVRRLFVAQTEIVRLGSLTLALFLGATTWCAAAGLLQPASLSDARAAAGKGSRLGHLVARSRLVRVDSVELARHVAPLGLDSAPDRLQRAAALDGVVTMELFADVTTTFHRTDLDATGATGYSWIGEVRGDPLRFASLIVDAGQITGHVQLLHRLFRIEPLGNGVHRVIELIPSRFPREYAVPRKRPRVDWTPPPAPDNRATPRWGAVENTIIRVLAVYTAAALAQTPNLKNEIKQAFALANTAFKKSKVPIKFVRAKTMSARDYVEAGPGFDGFVEDLENLGGDNGDEILTFVRKKRNKFKADLVSMFRTNDLGICGIANFTDTPGPIFKDFAYSIMTAMCIPNYSFHHEAGHNMSLRHDWFIDPETGLVYNHGYVNTKAECRIRTIMGYNNKCSGMGFPCTRINYFSTQAFKPKVDGTKCKIGIAKGAADAADNAKRLKEVRSKISRYRKEPEADAAQGVADAR